MVSLQLLQLMLQFPNSRTELRMLWRLSWIGRGASLALVSAMQPISQEVTPHLVTRLAVAVYAA